MCWAQVNPAESACGACRGYLSTDFLLHLHGACSDHQSVPPGVKLECEKNMFIVHAADHQVILNCDRKSKMLLRKENDVISRHITMLEDEADSSSPLGESDITMGSLLVLPGPGVPENS